MTEWRAFGTSEQAGIEVAHEIYRGMARAVSQGRPYLLGCPGGRSPRPVYHSLAQVLAQQPLDCSQLYIVMMDEYLLPAPSGGWQTPPPGQHYSCLGFAHREIVAPINLGLPPAWQITPQQILLPNPHNPTAYEQTIEQQGGIDLFLLASGAGDGHVAFNPAGSPHSSRTRVIELAQQTRLDNLHTFPQFASLEEVPTHGVSIGIAPITQYSRRAILLLFGKQKQLAFDRIRALTGYDPNWPASVVHACEQPSVYYCLEDL
jgi:glucosamine-6-phosphate deaminase